MSEIKHRIEIDESEYDALIMLYEACGKYFFLGNSHAIAEYYYIAREEVEK